MAKSEEHSQPVLVGRLIKGSGLANEAEHLLGRALHGPGEGVDTTGIPGHPPSLQGRLGAEVCSRG